MIGFRVDANENIATGHLMRCMAVAAECRRRGHQCLFVLAEEKETSRLRERQFPYEVLHTRWDAPETELQALREVASRCRLDWLVVDSYQATVEYLRELNDLLPVMYVDDMARESYPVSALLHYGVCGDEEEYRKRYEGTDIRLLTGTGYVPLREEFTKGEGQAGKKIPRERSLLVTTGGTDPYDVTGRLLNLCLNHMVFSGYEYHVIVGSMNGHERELQKMAQEHDRIHLHKNVTNMGDYMRRCQLAVSAGGTTLFELCACKIPTVCFSFADNQRPGTEGMERRNVMPYAGDARETDAAAAILEKLLPLVQEPLRRQEYADRMGRLIDGRGVERIADVLCQPV